MKLQKWTRRVPTRAGWHYLRAPNELPRLVMVNGFRSLSVRDDPSVVRLGIGEGGGQEPRWLDYYRELGCQWLRVPTPEELTGEAKP
jgi:hypothetical protein